MRQRTFINQSVLARLALVALAALLALGFSGCSHARGHTEVSYAGVRAAADWDIER